MNFEIKAENIGHFDVAVSGGGIAGACAAISAAREGAKVILIERAGSLGGTLTEGFMPILLDSQNKGGIVRELYAFLDSRAEVFDIVEKHKKIPGYEGLYTAFTSSHIGVREGRRIYGEYRITDEDILEGVRFDDGICLVTFGVDVHKLKCDDTTDCKRGYRAIPYNIPYRALVAKGVDNLLLAGRCISGDFYPHASYRVMGNMAASGEAAGFAAAKCAKECTLPRSFDGRRAREFMENRGYEV